MSNSEASAAMDLNGFESSEQYVPAPKRQKIDPTQRVAYVRSLASVELQRFIDEPPGEGMAVIYVFVNRKDSKVYVGKHEYANGGESLKNSRFRKHLKPNPIVKTYFANAMRKHGKEYFEYHVIWHGPESEVDDQERFWIGPDGLHTIKDHGGLGYNTRDGGDGGRLAPSAIAKLKATMSTPEFKAVHSERGKAQFASPEARAEQSERAKAQRANETPEERAEYNRKISETLSMPEAKAASSERGKKQAVREAAEGKPSLGERGKATQFGNWTEEQLAASLAKRRTLEAKAAASERAKAQFASPEARAEQSERAKAQFASPEARAEQSERAKAQRANETPEQRAELSRKQSEAHSTPEYTAAASERGKAQAAREAAEGKPSLGERGKATQIGNWTSEQWQEVLAKRAATAAKKRADKLSTLTGLARERKEKEYERSDRKTKIQKAKADALLKLEKYAGMDYQWRYRNVGKVQKEDGVHFFQDANGVWCAAFKTQGEGSSSEARTGGSGG